LVFAKADSPSHRLTGNLSAAVVGNKFYTRWRQVENVDLVHEVYDTIEEINVDSKAEYTA